jgi:hypothetical protein
MSRITAVEGVFSRNASAGLVSAIKSRTRVRAADQRRTKRLVFIRSLLAFFGFDRGRGLSTKSAEAIGPAAQFLRREDDNTVVTVLLTLKTERGVV